MPDSFYVLAERDGGKRGEKREREEIKKRRENNKNKKERLRCNNI